MCGAIAIGTFCAASISSAQESTGSNATSIPVHQLKNVVASDTNVLMGLSAARHLPNGSVLVNDPTKRQLILFDPTLKKPKIIADTSTNSPNSYGLRPSTGGLIPYVGDSSLFVDSESLAFLVINPQGEFTRVMAPTRASDLTFITSAPFPVAGFDAKGRLLYRTVRRPPSSVITAYDMSNPGTTFRVLPDSAPIMRQDLDRREVDTLGFLKIPMSKTAMITFSNGVGSRPVVNPLPTGDEWTVLPDGTVAIVRAQDYHIDWLGSDRKITSSPKMPFDWKRITAEDKEHIVDSVKKAEADRIAKIPPPPPGSFAFPNPVLVVDAKDLPDFYPPVRQGQVRSDMEGRVWILPSTSITASGGGLMYDVVNREGVIIERVQLPKGRTLVGFGPKGIVYMHNVLSPRSAAIERAEVAR